MAIKVYGGPISPYVRLVMLVLSEKGLDYEVVRGDKKAPDFLANINPFGKIPALEIDGFILYESRAIARFIATKFGSQGPNLLGTSLEEKALVDQWVEVEGHTFDPVAITVLLEKFVKPKFYEKETDEALVEENCTKLEAILDVYDAQLAKRKYLAGDFYSMADVVHIPMLQFFMSCTGKETLVSSRKHVNAWWEDISSRPVWKKILEENPMP